MAVGEVTLPAPPAPPALLKVPPEAVPPAPPLAWIVPLLDSVPA